MNRIVVEAIRKKTSNSNAENLVKTSGVSSKNFNGIVICRSNVDQVGEFQAFLKKLITMRLGNFCLFEFQYKTELSDNRLQGKDVQLI